MTETISEVFSDGSCALNLHCVSGSNCEHDGNCMQESYRITGENVCKKTAQNLYTTLNPTARIRALRNHIKKAGSLSPDQEALKSITTTFGKAIQNEYNSILNIFKKNNLSRHPGYNIIVHLLGNIIFNAGWIRQLHKKKGKIKKDLYEELIYTCQVLTRIKSYLELLPYNRIGLLKGYLEMIKCARLDEGTYVKFQEGVQMLEIFLQDLIKRNLNKRKKKSHKDNIRPFKKSENSESNQSPQLPPSEQLFDIFGKVGVA